MQHRLPGRKVLLAADMYVVNEQFTTHMKDGGTIEAVNYTKDSKFSPYQVLVRNPEGKTLELPLAMLIIDEAK